MTREQANTKAAALAIAYAHRDITWAEFREGFLAIYGEIRFARVMLTRCGVSAEEEARIKTQQYQLARDQHWDTIPVQEPA